MNAPRGTALVAALLMTVAMRARAQGGLLIQGLVDAEQWSTDTSSTYLTRNHGAASQLLRAQLWGAFEPRQGVFFFAQGQVEGGTARQFGDNRTVTELRQAGVRIARDPRLVLDLGKMFHPMAPFAGRSASNRNPLIGTPDGYSPVYPVGAMASGNIARFDYRAAVVSLPLTHRDYVPTAGSAFRPVLVVGVAPVTGLHLGVAATSGPYLNEYLPADQLANRDWRSYHQRQLNGDLEYGFGHVDLRVEYAWADYDVPAASRVKGHAGYVEGRYTITPRLFAAARWEETDYPFVRGGIPWFTRSNEFQAWELGGGYRLTETTLLKASWLGDKWQLKNVFNRPGGRALAVQLSQSFDVMDWVDRWRQGRGL